MFNVEERRFSAASEYSVSGHRFTECGKSHNYAVVERHGFSRAAAASNDLRLQPLRWSTRIIVQPLNRLNTPNCLHIQGTYFEIVY
jgi:hypothetical protein